MDTVTVSEAIGLQQKTVRRQLGEDRYSTRVGYTRLHTGNVLILCNATCGRGSGRHRLARSACYIILQQPIYIFTAAASSTCVTTIVAIYPVGARSAP